MAASRRALLLAWQAVAVDKAIDTAVGFAADVHAPIASALCWLVPHEQTLAYILRTLWHAALRDKVLDSFKPTAAYDGQAQLFCAATLCIFIHECVLRQGCCTLGCHV